MEFGIQIAAPVAGPVFTYVFLTSRWAIIIPTGVAVVGLEDLAFGRRDPTFDWVLIGVGLLWLLWAAGRPAPPPRS